MQTACKVGLLIVLVANVFIPFLPYIHIYIAFHIFFFFYFILILTYILIDLPSAAFCLIARSLCFNTSLTRWTSMQSSYVIVTHKILWEMFLSGQELVKTKIKMWALLFLL